MQPTHSRLLPFAPLPYARRSLNSIYFDQSFLALPAHALPLHLWELHRVLQVGGTAHLSACETAGRGYNNELFLHLVEGAGFSVQSSQPFAAAAPPTGANTKAKTSPEAKLQVELVLRAEQTLADTVGPQMRLLLVGLNPSLNAAAAGVAFCTSANRAWPALAAAGLTNPGTPNSEQNPSELLMTQTIGMTDLVKRATARADQIAPQEFRYGLARLETTCQLLQPRAVCVLGLSGWRQAVGKHVEAGLQETQLAGRPVYLMPNPSGLNTHTNLAALTIHFERAAALADEAS